MICPSLKRDKKKERDREKRGPNTCMGVGFLVGDFVLPAASPNEMDPFSVLWTVGGKNIGEKTR